jgi:hypothetical protein
MGSTPYIFEFLFQVLIGFISYKISYLHFLDRFGLTLTYFVFKNNHSLINCSEEPIYFCIDDSFYDSFSIFTLQVNDEVCLELVDTLLKGFFDGSEQIGNLLSNLLNIIIYAENFKRKIKQEPAETYKYKSLQDGVVHCLVYG